MLGNRRMINPLLGVYYGIFTAGYIGLGVLLLILEYMGVIEGHISYAMTAVAFVLAGIIALAATTVTSDDFFTSGRRVPAGLNGLVILVVTFGGVGLSAVLATLFFLGIDGYGMMLGMLGGVMLSGVLAAAFIRKAGAYTLASFFEIRYNSRFAGVLAGLALLLPVALLALAELTLLKTVAPYVLGVSEDLALGAVVVTILVLLLPGGVRSMSWAQCALAIVVLLGLMLPLIIISLDLTNLPIAQMTYGSLIEDLKNFESVSGDATAQPVWSRLVAGAVQPVQLSYIGGERAFSGLELISMFMIFAAGVAGMPALLQRATVTFSVFEARKSFAWGAALIGLVILTLPAYAVFFRYMLFDPQLNLSASSLPDWAQQLTSLGLFQAVDGDGNGQLSPRELLFGRDAVLLGLPMIAGLNQTFQSMVFAGLIAAAVGGLIARVLGISQTIARNLNPKKGSLEADISGLRSMMLSRIIITLVALLIGGVAYQIEVDAFQLFIAAIIFSALTIFPALILSVWWRGMSVTGLLFLMPTGLCLGAGLLVLTEGGLALGPFGFGLFEMALAALLLVFLSGWLGSVIGPKPDRIDLETLTEIRTPGGEILYDRMLRLAMPRRGIGGGSR
ncbi:MAG: hypothetical protein DHS20C08_21360 [Rhodomicrobium sp.]|nr:MAG: hypothetical protein DHS20C08_21360 [Rhodomicrobium sp.]